MVETQQLENNPIKNWAKDLNIHFIKEDKQMENNHMKVSIIKKFQIKTMRYYHVTIKNGQNNNKTPDNTKWWQGSKVK